MSRQISFINLRKDYPNCMVQPGFCVFSWNGRGCAESPRRRGGDAICAWWHVQASKNSRGESGSTLTRLWPTLTLTQSFALPGAALSVRRKIRLLRVMCICEGIFLRTRLNGDSRGPPLERESGRRGLFSHYSLGRPYFQNDFRSWFILWNKNAILCFPISNIWFCITLISNPP